MSELLLKDGKELFGKPVSREVGMVDEGVAQRTRGGVHGQAGLEETEAGRFHPREEGLQAPVLGAGPHLEAVEGGVASQELLVPLAHSPCKKKKGKVWERRGNRGGGRVPLRAKPWVRSRVDGSRLTMWKGVNLTEGLYDEEQLVDIRFARE